jgi:hypothetical protein
MSKASVAEIALYHKATGCPIAQAATTLEAMQPELRRRVLAAATSQVGILHDPIEDEPAHSATVAAALVEAEEIIQKNGIAGRRGACHTLWSEQARILRERHGLVWHSRREMNPDVVFD